VDKVLEEIREADRDAAKRDIEQGFHEAQGKIWPALVGLSHTSRLIELLSRRVPRR
jgi:hypothetical protein